MKIFTDPEHFAFTNRFGGPHFNKSLLHRRITMMNRRSSWRSWWRYGAVGMALFFTVMCRTVSKESKEAIPEDSDKVGDTRYLVSKNGKLYGVITPYATDKDIQEIGKILAKYQVPFSLLGVERDEKGRIVHIKDVVLGEYGSEAMKVVKNQSNFGSLKKAFFDFCYDPEFGCYPNIHPDEFPNILEKTLLQEGVISIGSSRSIRKHLSYGSSLKERGGRGKITLIPESEMEYTWTGSMNQLMEASFFKRKKAMLYVRPDHHLDLYDEYKKSVTVFVDRQEVTLEELKNVHIRQVAKVYAHKRHTEQTLSGVSNRPSKETDYVIWIDRAPNRIKRDSTIHVVSPFYTGDF